MVTKETIRKYITEALKKAKEVETKEATATGGGYGYSSPAFSMWSEDDEAKSEYKRMEDTQEEFTEATTSASVGAYDVPGFQDVNMRGNTPKGKGTSWKKSQIPGGSFVDINPKCKTFPYCNQGNTGAVRYRKSKPKKKKRKTSPMNEAIYNVSLKTGLSEIEIKNIILSHIDSNL
jgi:hypothetical protein